MLLHSRVLKNLNIIGLEAARITRRIYAGSYEWSPEWRQREGELKLWRVAKKRFDHRIRGRYLRRLMKKAGNTDCFNLNKVDTLIRLAAAKAALEDIKLKAGQY